jgi:hypothetical protein
LAPLEYHDYDEIPSGFFPSARFFIKTECDINGQNCKTGNSLAPCPPGGCAPPFESKVEVTFGDKSRPTSSEQHDHTWYNPSLVDGYTLPYYIKVKNGDGSPYSAGNGGIYTTTKADGTITTLIVPDMYRCGDVDASRLDLNKCPSDEIINGKSYDLRLYDNNRIIGCMSPCKKLNYPAPYGYGMNENEDPALHMCCPTPACSTGSPLTCRTIDGKPASNCQDPATLCTIPCNPANGCLTPQSCSDPNDPNSVVHTKYVKAIHEMSPNSYSYSYDDVNGLFHCSSGVLLELSVV